MSLPTTVDAPSVVVPDTPSGLWGSFPSTDLVAAASGLFTGHRVPDRTLGLPLIATDRHQDRETVEGPRSYVFVAPGLVRVAMTDPVRADRTRTRADAAARQRHAAHAAALDSWHAPLVLPDVTCSPARGRSRGAVRSWSRKSRAQMVKVLAMIDWTALLEQGTPALVTLTYPGDWLTVAPNAAASRRHLLLLRKRFERFYGRRLVGVWKREFQRRGAPHWHLLMVPPGVHRGVTFRDWLSREWADIVAHPDGEERRRHVLAGTGVDYREGLKCQDPASIGVYFSKHGTFSAKDYQNEVPAEWGDHESVGRFWGVWGLSKAVAGVEVPQVEADAVARVMRRYSRSRAYVARVPVWRYRTVVDPETGAVSARWRRSTAKRRIYRMHGRTGFLVVPDGPSLAADLARHLEQLRRPTQVVTRSGAGPVGFLP